MQVNTANSKFRHHLFEYLANGPDYIPFSTLDLKSKLKRRNETATQFFKPFNKERDLVGRLKGTSVQIQSTPNVLISNEFDDQLTEEAKPAQEDSKPVSMLKKITTQKSLQQANFTTRSANKKTTSSFLPYLSHDELNIKVYTARTRYPERNEIDTQTKYITLLSTQSENKVTTNVESTNFYTCNRTKVENGQLDGPKNEIKKPTSQHISLIGKSHKEKLTSTPAVGIYNPKFELQDKRKQGLKWIQIKPPKQSIQLDVAENKNTKEPKQLNPSNGENYEINYTRQINQINREVDLEKQRNPYQWLHPNSHSLLKHVLTQEEAVDIKLQLINNLKLLKDSSQRFKNLMNTRK